MPIGDSITQPVPAVGAAGTGYAAQIVAFLQEAKARLEAKVALTSLLAGLFDLANNGLANAQYLGMYNQASAPSTPVGSFQRYNGDAYYVGPSGAVRITNGASLNVTAAHGITGNYGSGPEELKYVLTDLEYYAYSDAGLTKWARIGAQGYDIYGTLTGTTRVRLAWAGGANPSYTLTLPATLPATTKLLQLSNGGALSASNILATDENLELTGTGFIKHSDWTEIHPFTPGGDWQVSAGAPPTWRTPGSGGNVNISASSTVFYPLKLGSNKNSIKAIVIYGRAFLASCTLSLYQTSGIGTGATSMSVVSLSGAVTSITVTADGLYNPRTLTLTTPFLNSTGEELFLCVTTPGGGNMDVISYAVVHTA